MGRIVGSLCIFFDDPFWVGVCEVSLEGSLQAARAVFGAEPRESEVYAYFLENWNRLRFSPPVADAAVRLDIKNPKRRQRQAARQLKKATAVGTKAQQALKLMQEQNKQIRTCRKKEQRAQKTEYQFLLKEQKRKQKHRGR